MARKEQDPEIPDELEDEFIPSGATDDMEVIAFNIVQRRKQLSISQTALAEAMQAVGLTHWRQNTVSRIETGKQELSLREVRALEAILGSITSGIESFERVRKSADRITNMVLARKLQDIEGSLLGTLKNVRVLRTAFDDSYEPSQDELDQPLME